MKNPPQVPKAKPQPAPIRRSWPKWLVAFVLVVLPSVLWKFSPAEVAAFAVFVATVTGFAAGLSQGKPTEKLKLWALSLFLGASLTVLVDQLLRPTEQQKIERFADEFRKALADEVAAVGSSNTQMIDAVTSPGRIEIVRCDDFVSVSLYGRTKPDAKETLTLAKISSQPMSVATAVFMTGPEIVTTGPSPICFNETAFTFGMPEGYDSVVHHGRLFRTVMASQPPDVLTDGVVAGYIRRRGAVFYRESVAIIFAKKPASFDDKRFQAVVYAPKDLDNILARRIARQIVDIERICSGTPHKSAAEGINLAAEITIFGAGDQPTTRPLKLEEPYKVVSRPPN